jgi:hypothetical protein
MFVVKNKDFFKTNSEFHDFTTRYNHDLHIPTANLTLFQHGVRYTGIKTYNQLSNNIPKFKVALQKFLLENSFYTLEEYYSWK